MRNPCRIDLLIRGGAICDGSGSPLFQADIGISDGVIVQMGNPGRVPAGRVLDARDCVVSPGFIDIHSHTDEGILIDPRAPSKIHQGVTTEVVGNCGSSPAPLSGEFLEDFRKSFREKSGVDVTWSSVAEFFQLLTEKKIGINYVMLVGNANLRGGIAGFESRPLKKGEKRRIRDALALAFREGAWGLSSGLIYVPSSFSDIEELIQLTEVVKEHEGIYSTHMRGEGDTLLEAISEALDVSRGSGVSLEISHLKASGEKNWDKLDRALEIIVEAQKEGLTVGCDFYPYCASSTGLDSIFPLWAKEGGTDRFLGNLRDSGKGARIREELGRRDWSKIIFSSVKNSATAWILGKSVEEVSSLIGKPPLDAVIDLLLQEEGDIAIIYFAQSEANVLKVMSLPFSAVGSDATARSGRDAALPTDLPHPRAYGSFPRILGHYVRELHAITLEEAIRKMTSLPASRLGISRRGLLREGYFADITIFDPLRIKEKSTYAEPHQFPGGIEHVLVNGEVVIDRGNHTGALPGRVLRRGGPQ